MSDPLTVAQALRGAAARLADTSDTARLDAELLLAHVLGVSRSDMLLRHMQDDAPASFAKLIERRAAHEPVAYIIGAQEFFGLSFKVSPAVLIPRGDSESVVQAALDAAPDAKNVLDCGTGSGALVLAFLAERPDAMGIGVDRSPDALAIARGNAQSLGLAARAAFRLADWTKPGWPYELGQFDCIIANPPYVEDDAALDRQVREYEPGGALFAGSDGLDDYRILIPQLPDLLKPQGVAVLEIGAAQAAAVSAIAGDHGFAVEVRQDLGGRDRALVLRLRLGKAAGSG